jgi:prepilin-type N-terminal cleavage/methylation domain-containing protein
MRTIPETGNRLADRSNSGIGSIEREASPAIRFPISGFRYRARRAFTLVEVLISIALVGLLLVALNAFIFSMGELWGRGTDQRLFEQHVRAVTHFLDEELRAATLPPVTRIGDTPITGQEITPDGASSDNLLTFVLPEGSRLLAWPDDPNTPRPVPLPEVVCSLQARDGQGLVLLWHSALETRFTEDPPREIVISPLVTALSYDYFDPNFKRWTTQTVLQKDTNGALEVPQRLRLTFTYNKMTRDTAITLPATTQGLPNF